MKKLITLLIAIVAMVNMYSQNQDTAFPHVVPMTPNAAELAKYVDYPVSYYTGTPNTSIILYEINVDGLNLPITLNYHASGIRVDQEATWVGLGWSLDVGSRISRTVNCVDDFFENTDPNYPSISKGYYDAPEQVSIFQTHYYPPFLPENLGWDSVLLYDSEPDVFYYNLPGISGKFILDKTRGAVLFDKSHNLKIEILRNSLHSPVSFKITDKEGNQYLYYQREITKNYSQTGFLNKNIHTNSTKYDDDTFSFIAWDRHDEDPITYIQNPYPMVTSWCLTKITTKNGREINFSYDIETQYLPTQESCENYRRNSSSYLYYYKSKIVNTALRLSTIDGDFGRIEFNCSDRFDIKGTSKKLESFSIYNNTNTLIKSFKFDYTYFNDDYSGDNQGSFQYEHVFKRLKLNKLIEYNLNEYSSIIPLNSGYSFDYYDGNIPPKNSKNVDYWGFQNGKSYGSDYYVGLRLPNNENYTGVKKDANFEKAIIGTLKKITYPTGGTAEFKFESNTFSSSYFEVNTYEETYTDPYNSYVHLPVFNNYNSDDYAYTDYPSQRVHSFKIEYETTIKINCYLENVLGTRDLNYNYESYANPLGKLRKTSPASNDIYTYICPFVWDYSFSQPLGEGSEITLSERQFTLQPGTYEFEAFTPPNDVYVAWILYIDNYTPPTSGTVMGPYNGGGIRIVEIETDAKIRKFKYPTGTMLVEPVLYHKLPRVGVPEYLFYQSTPITQVSESKTPLSTFNHGNFVGYDWVIEVSDYDKDDNVSKIKYTYYNDTESDLFDDQFPDSPRYLNYTNGLIQSIEKLTTKYPNTTNTLVEKEDFFYTSTQSNVINAFKDKGMIEPGTTILGRRILPYYYQVEWPLKTKHVTTLNTDDGNSIVSETDYSYNSKDLMQSISYNLNNSEIIEKVKYPLDFNDVISLSMVDKNIIGLPIEKTTFKKVGTNQEIQLSQQKTVYKDWENGNFLPETIQTSKGVNTLRNSIIYHSYDNKGNLTELSKADGTHITYIWGYQQTQPLAEVENATYAQVLSYVSNLQTLSDADNDRTIGALGKEGTLRTALNNLRIALPNAMITTYTYDLLIGVTSITDPLGQTIYYHYDAFNRLEYVLDHYGKVLSKNEYHYKN